MSNDINGILDNVFGGWEDIFSSASLEDMSKYADHITVNNASNIEFNRQQVKGLELYDYKRIFKMCNPTSFGNLAYSCLNAPEEYRNIWTTFFRNIVVENQLPINFVI